MLLSILLLGCSHPSQGAEPKVIAAPLARSATKPDADLDRLVELLHATSPPEVQQAALASLKKLASPRVAELLLAKWNDLLPTVRAEAATILLGRTEWSEALLGVIESGKLTSSALGTAQQQKLLTHAQPGIRERAMKLFTKMNPDRQKVLEAYRGVADLKGNAGRGAQYFGGNCATCHQFRGAGTGIGPDLVTMSNKPVATLLVAILDPNQAVDPAFVYYIGYTKDNRDVSGVISSESSNSLTLRNAGGVEDTVLRADLKELRSSGLSLMPEGFENALNPQAMADLIAFIQSGVTAK